tara:strand:+ start:62 stop:775 length:714 start_codon:yes stop_codon:yes gene_type:complete
MEKDGDLAELMGIHIGDGCISVTEKYFEYYLGGDLKEEIRYHDEWVAPLFNRKIMLPLLNREVVYKKHPKVGIYGFHIFNKELVDFFKKLEISSGTKLNIVIPSWIKSDDKFSLRFLRGLFDTDGNLYFDKNRSSRSPINNCPTIKLGTVSKLLIDEVYDLLVKFGMHPRIKNPYKGKRDKNPVHTVLLYRKGDIEFFIRNIGFKNPKHSTKWRLFEKYRKCLPKTTLNQRLTLLNR